MILIGAVLAAITALGATPATATTDHPAARRSTGTHGAIRWGRQVVIGHRVGSVSLHLNHRGAAVLAGAAVAHHHAFVVAAARDAGGRWGRVTRLGPFDHAGGVWSGISATGRAVVVWATQTTTFARERRPGGHWSPTRVLEHYPDGPYTTDFSMSLSGSGVLAGNDHIGDAVVTAVRPSLHIETPVVVAPAGRTRNLDPGEMQASIDRSGRITASWTKFTHDNQSFQSGFCQAGGVTPSGRVLAIRTLHPGVYGATMDASPSGGRVMLSLQSDASTVKPTFSVRHAGDTWAQHTPPTRAHDIRTAEARRTAVAWWVNNTGQVMAMHSHVSPWSTPAPVDGLAGGHLTVVGGALLPGTRLLALTRSTTTGRHAELAQLSGTGVGRTFDPGAGTDAVALAAAGRHAAFLWRSGRRLMARMLTAVPPPSRRSPGPSH